MTKLFDEIELLLRQIIREEIFSAIGISRRDAVTSISELRINETVIPLLTAKDVADMLSLSVQRVYELARRSRVNGFPVIKLGERQYRFDRNAIYNWMEHQSI